jgi:hypothetical protein
MTEDEKKILEEEFTKAGSVPALLETMARSEKKEFQQLRDQVEQGTVHPTGDELYNYVLGWLDRKESLLVMDHLVLCGRCLREVIRIRRLEEALTEDALERADKVPLLPRIKGFISNLFPPVPVHALAPEPVRGVETESRTSGYAPGAKLDFLVDIPADGYVVILHCCEETGEAKLVFPELSEDDPKISAGQRLGPVEGYAEGPQGKHFLKIFCTRSKVLDLTDVDPDNEEELKSVIDRFLDALGMLSEQDWREGTFEYQVLKDEEPGNQ